MDLNDNTEERPGAVKDGQSRQRTRFPNHRADSLASDGQNKETHSHVAIRDRHSGASFYMVCSHPTP